MLQTYKNSLLNQGLIIGNQKCMSQTFTQNFPLFRITKKYDCAKHNLLYEHQGNFRVKVR